MQTEENKETTSTKEDGLWNHYSHDDLMPFFVYNFIFFQFWYVCLVSFSNTGFRFGSKPARKVEVYIK